MHSRGKKNDAKPYDAVHEEPAHSLHNFSVRKKCVSALGTRTIASGNESIQARVGVLPRRFVEFAMGGRE